MRYKAYGHFDPVACAGVLTGGDYEVWKAPPPNKKS